MGPRKRGRVEKEEDRLKLQITSPGSASPWEPESHRALVSARHARRREGHGLPQERAGTFVRAELAAAREGLKARIPRLPARRRK